MKICFEKKKSIKRFFINEFSFRAVWNGEIIVFIINQLLPYQRKVDFQKRHVHRSRENFGSFLKENSAILEILFSVTKLTVY